MGVGSGKARTYVGEIELKIGDQGFGKGIVEGFSGLGILGPEDDHPGAADLNDRPAYFESGKRAPAHRTQMYELADAVMVTRSGITRVADRLEEEGLVIRVPSREDRRSVWLTLTEAGHQKLSEVWPDHQESIYLHFGQHLDDQDPEAIQAATEKVFLNYQK